MYAVGRLGSYITQGVYTVSGPFHPFGGAVDIVVVKQEDGSLKSSPWYVRFGKFQGVLKAKERVVDINVNGVDAGFGMYLDPRGEAYFLREVDSGDGVEAGSLCSPSCENVNGKEHDKQDRLPVKSKSLDCDFDKGSPVSDGGDGNSKGSRILGFVLGRRSMKEHTLLKDEDDSNGGRMTQLQRAEIVADLLESRWSKNDSFKSIDSRNDDEEVTCGRLETSVVLHEQHFVNNDSQDGGGVNEDVDENYVSEECSRTRLDDGIEPEVGLVTGEGSLEIVPESYAEGGSNQEDAATEVVPCGSVAVPLCQNMDDNLTKEVVETNEVILPLEPNGELQVSEPLVEEQLIFGDLDDSKPNVCKTKQEVTQAGSESTALMYGPNLLRVKTYREHSKGEFEGLKGNLRRCSSDLEISKSREIPHAEMRRQAKSLPNICRVDDSVVQDNQEESLFYSPVGRFRSNWDLLREDATRLRKAIIKKELQQNADDLSKDVKDGSIASDGAGGSWSLWPFRRLASKNATENSKKDPDVEIGQETDGEKEWPSPKSDKMHTRELTPTAEQLASLNLAEGQNTVTFTFSTAVLGSQKVDARIYLWSWDARIVISDVDGTITKSDVLGQFMPLVGRDWSHIGVTHLFSAINENGYQMLYLSARSISQASITRQFLFNLKQDGKALPDGPVVISPDGLFPSLFREVIRRAPHEFKIACLEDIKACFPPERNPFYAGFGNRDTDEFSYLKVGIPKGKIFIINPKGEVVINRCIDSKSYSSLHALVNGIFPPVSMHEEQEDYNSWNFWKLPPPTVD